MILVFVIVLPLAQASYNRVTVLEKYRCDGQTIWLNMPTTKLSFASGFTMSFWMRAKSPPATSPTTGGVLIALKDTFNENWNVLSANYDSNSSEFYLMYNIQDLTTTFSPTNQPLVDSTTVDQNANWYLVMISFQPVGDKFQVTYIQNGSADTATIIVPAFETSNLEIYIGSFQKPPEKCPIDFRIEKLYFYQGVLSSLNDFDAIASNAPGDLKYLYKPSQSNFYSQNYLNLISSTKSNDFLQVTNGNLIPSFKNESDLDLFLDYHYRIYSLPLNPLPSNSYDQSYTFMISYTPMVNGRAYAEGVSVGSEMIYSFYLYLRTGASDNVSYSTSKKIAATWEFNLKVNSARLSLIVNNADMQVFSVPLTIGSNADRSDFELFSSKFFMLVVRSNCLYPKRTVTFYKYGTEFNPNTYDVDVPSPTNTTPPLDYTDQHCIFNQVTQPGGYMYIRVYEISFVWGRSVVINKDISDQRSVYLDTTASPVTLACKTIKNIQRTVNSFNQYLTLAKCESQPATTCPLANGCVYCPDGGCHTCKPGYELTETLSCVKCNDNLQLYDPIFQKCVTGYTNASFLVLLDPNFYLNTLLTNWSATMIGIITLKLFMQSLWNGSTYQSHTSQVSYVNTLELKPENMWTITGIPGPFDKVAASNKLADFSHGSEKPEYAAYFTVSYSYISSATYNLYLDKQVPKGFYCGHYKKVYKPENKFFGKCIPSCPANMKTDSNTQSCQEGTENCKSLDGTGNCTECNIGYNLNSNSCIAQAETIEVNRQKVSYSDITKRCLNTVSYCAQCTGETYDNCASCISPYKLSQGYCKLYDCDDANCLMCPESTSSCVYCIAGYQVVRQGESTVCIQSLPRNAQGGKQGNQGPGGNQPGQQQNMSCKQGYVQDNGGNNQGARVGLYASQDNFTENLENKSSYTGQAAPQANGSGGGQSQQGGNGGQPAQGGAGGAGGQQQPGGQNGGGQGGGFGGPGGSMSNQGSSQCKKCNTGCLQCDSKLFCTRCDARFTLDRQKGVCNLGETKIVSQEIKKEEPICNYCDICQNYSKLYCQSCSTCRKKCSCSIKIATSFRGILITCPDMIFDSEAVLGYSNDFVYLELDRTAESTIKVVYKSKQFSISNIVIKNEYVMESRGCTNDPNRPYMFYDNFSPALASSAAKSVRGNTVVLRGTIITVISFISGVFAQLMFLFVQLENFFITISLYKMPSGFIFDWLNSWNFQDTSEIPKSDALVDDKNQYLFAYNISKTQAWKFYASMDLYIFHIGFVGFYILWSVFRFLRKRFKFIAELTESKKFKFVTYIKRKTRVMVFLVAENYVGNLLCIMAYLISYARIMTTQLGAFAAYYSAFMVTLAGTNLLYNKWKYTQIDDFMEHSYFKILEKPEMVLKEKILVLASFGQDVFFLFSYITSFTLSKFPKVGLFVNCLLIVAYIFFWVRHRPMFYPFFFYFRFLYLFNLLIFVFLVFLLSVGVPLSTVALDVFYVICHVFRFAETISMGSYIDKDNKPPPKNQVHDGKISEDPKEEEAKTSKPDVPMLQLPDQNGEKSNVLISSDENNSLIQGQNPPELKRNLSIPSSRKDLSKKQMSKKDSLEIKSSPKKRESTLDNFDKDLKNEP